MSGNFTEGQNLNLAIPISSVKELDQEKIYSVEEFYELSTENNSIENIEDVENDGFSFESVEKLMEETQRNPLDFSNPVTVSVKGYVIRHNDLIYLVPIKRFLFTDVEDIIGKNTNGNESIVFSNLEGFFKYVFRIHMVDDSKNRVITGDTVIITGVYNHNDRTISNCTYKHTVLD